jgi:hypothetical protein
MRGRGTVGHAGTVGYMGTGTVECMGRVQR